VIKFDSFTIIDMPNFLQKALGAPAIETVADPAAADEVAPLSTLSEITHDVKRIRIGQYSGRVLLGLNQPAARDLMGTPTFWYHMDAQGQIPIFLRPDEMVDGLFSHAQAVLMPKVVDGERGPDLSEQQIGDFARMCVEGKIVRRWAVPEAEAARHGVIVCDNRQALPDGPFDSGPQHSDVIAASLIHYEPQYTADTIAS
jgi:hypothetical protein